MRSCAELYFVLLYALSHLSTGENVMRILGVFFVAMLALALPAQAHEKIKTFQTVPQGFVSYVVQPGDTWGSLTTTVELKQLAMRVNRMNIEPRRGSEVLLPVNDVAWYYVPVPHRVDGVGRHLIIYDDQQFFGAYEDGRLIHWGPVSTGKQGKETPFGHFKATWKSRYHRSSLYDNARMYFAIQFSGHYFTHEYTELPGYPASNGCVRMFWNDAKWKFSWLQLGDRVSIVPATAFAHW